MCNNGTSIKERIEKAQKRLKESYGAAEINAKEPCPLKKPKVGPPHGGLCEKCNQETHSLLRNEEAMDEARKIMKHIEEEGSIAPDSKDDDLKRDNLFQSEGSGTMFGVLICVDNEGNTHVLKGFSGGFDETGKTDVQGWAPPVPFKNPEQAETLKQKSLEAKGKLQEVIEQKNTRSEQVEALKEEYQRRIDKMGNQLKTIGQEAEREHGKGSAEYMRIAEEIYKPLKIKQSELKAEKNKQVEELKNEIDENLEKARQEWKDTNAAWQQYLAEGRELTNFNDEKGSFKDICNPSDMDGQKIANKPQTGFCAAPKLLSEAQQKGLTPVSMAEFWLGSDTETKKNKEFYESCSCCRSFLGFALCGLADQQKKLDSNLEEKKDNN